MAAKTSSVSLMLLLLLVAILPAQRTEAATDSAAIDSIVQRFMEESHVEGLAVAIVKDGAIIYTKGYGIDSAGTPMTHTSLTRIASMSKSFTALAVLQLVDQGNIDLDAPLETYLPELTIDNPHGTKLTVRHLLNQTSGLTTRNSSEYAQETPATLAAALPIVNGATLETEPGTTFKYHNPNFMLAARLVEVVSGEPFSDYLRRHIFAPLGMEQTVETALCDTPVEGLVNGHIMVFNQAVSIDEPHAFCAGSGGVVSSADDIAQWLILQMNGGKAPDGSQLVSPERLALMHTPPHVDTNYAMGWHRSITADGITRIEHGGALSTYTSHMAFDPDRKRGVVVLANTNSIPVVLADNLLNTLEGAPTPVQPVSDPRIWIDVIGAGLTMFALGLGIRGMRRARTWASNRRASAWWSVGLRLLPYFGISIAVAFLPAIVRTYLGGDVNWAVLATLAPMVTLFCVCLGAMSGSVVIMRMIAFIRK